MVAVNATERSIVEINNTATTASIFSLCINLLCISLFNGSITIKVYNKKRHLAEIEYSLVLSEKKCERKRYLEDLAEDGYYEPYLVDLADVAWLIKWKNIVSEEDANALNFTIKDEKRLAKVL
jgi:hypothetical protein